MQFNMVTVDSIGGSESLSGIASNRGRQYILL
jgi:hypothetical protein